MTKNRAIAKAKTLAKQGPRVAAVLKVGLSNYAAAPGYMDADREAVLQVLLVTPDGRTWTPIK